MSGEMTTAGDIATGMLIGRAVEPRSGEHGGDGGGHSLCLNCGTALIGEYCHACGQNGHVHKTLGSIGHDLLHGVFHFEGKVWRTLPMLVARPGQLTRRYIDGERARFVSPLAMFLFFVFLMFAAIHSMGGTDLPEIARLTPEQRSQSLEQLGPRIAEAKVDRDAVKARIDAADDAGQDTTALKRQRDELNNRIDALEQSRAAILTLTDGTGKPNIDRLHTGWETLDHGIKKAAANPELAIYKLQSSAYKYSWALIPISVPFVALLFVWRRRFKLYDHAIFVTYSLAFMLLLATAVTVLMIAGTPSRIYGNLIAFAPPVHIFFQLRGTYQLRWFSALWRTVALVVFAGITLTLFLMLLLGMGLMD